jgi:ParB-like chromosome segregation protein Spo0J
MLAGCAVFIMSPSLEHLAPATPKKIGLGGLSFLKERLRTLQPDVVNTIAESMKSQGPLHPITVIKRRGGGYTIVAGVHRFEAAKKLKWPSIMCIIREGIDADQAELIEIDENLVRANLDEAEEALHLDRRKELYEKIHPETKSTKAGGPGRGKKRTQSQNETESADAFIDDTAKTSGKGRSTIARKAKRGKAGKAWLKDVAGTCLAKGDEIDALVELPSKEATHSLESPKAAEKSAPRPDSNKSSANGVRRSLAPSKSRYPTRSTG